MEICSKGTSASQIRGFLGRSNTCRSVGILGRTDHGQHASFTSEQSSLKSQHHKLSPNHRLVERPSPVDSFWTEKGVANPGSHILWRPLIASCCLHCVDWSLDTLSGTNWKLNGAPSLFFTKYRFQQKPRRQEPSLVNWSPCLCSKRAMCGLRLRWHKLVQDGKSVWVSIKFLSTQGPHAAKCQTAASRSNTWAPLAPEFLGQQQTVQLGLGGHAFAKLGSQFPAKN